GDAELLLVFAQLLFGPFPLGDVAEEDDIGGIASDFDIAEGGFAGELGSILPQAHGFAGAPIAIGRAVLEITFDATEGVPVQFLGLKDGDIPADEVGGLI